MKDLENEQFFVSFIKENKKRFYLLAYSYVKNEQDALDIIQDSIHKALKSLYKVKDLQSIKSWFYKIVIRTAIDFLRKNKKMYVMEDVFLENNLPPYNNSYENFDLKKSLDELPLKYKEVIILRYFEDIKIEDVANILGLNINTVKSRLYKALKILKLNLENEEDL